MLRVKVILLFALLLTIVPDKLIAQWARGFEMEGGVRSSDLVEPFSLYVSGKYARWFNPYAAYTIGGGFSYALLDESFRLGNRAYYIRDNKIVNLYCTTGIKLSIPTVKNIGLMADADFQFEPIPFNSAIINASTYDWAKTKWVYTHFNPSYNVQLSLFYNLKSEHSKRTARLAIGCGFDNYNPLNTYYRAVVDDIKLSDHLKLKSEKLNFSIFLRISGLSL
jgi:hypothetical protein